MSSETDTIEHLSQTIASVGFANLPAAAQILRRISRATPGAKVLERLLPYLLSSLASSGNPDRVLANLERFIWSAPDFDEKLEWLASQPRRLEILVRLISGSQFLTEILLRNPEYFDSLTELSHWNGPVHTEQFLKAARHTIESSASISEQLDDLRRFQRKELLRIGMGDLLDLFDITAVTSQLSNLADSLVQACLEIAVHQTGISSRGFVVLGMGKLGGNELNYSSDIDLLFITAEEPSHHLRLAERLIEGLANITNEGFLYRVDMRLRPWGSVGALVTSLKGYLTYLEKHARLWEKQALLKARTIAGDQEVGSRFLELASQQLFGASPDSIRLSIHDLKQRTENQLRLKGREHEVKLGEGSIRDVEFVVQYLQLIHGGDHPEIRSGNTLEAIQRLHKCNFLESAEARILSEGYTFLRAIEHHLQLMDYRQTHLLPSQPEALSDLARRLGFSGDQAGDLLMNRYLQHSAAIRLIYLHYIERPAMNDRISLPDASSNQEPVRRHIERLDASYQSTFSQAEIQHHAFLADRLDSENLVEVEAKQLEDGRWRVTIIAFDYPGELSLICGLMFVHSLNILGGEVFTYEPAPPAEPQKPASRRGPEADSRRKIVDVFTVVPEMEPFAEANWARYAEELAELLRMMQRGQRREARGELAKRVAAVLQDNVHQRTTLYPIEIQFDNTLSEHYTILYIESIDTIGFLYELTNALAYWRVYIARVSIDTMGNRVRDTLYVLDDKGRKITDPEKQRELVAAITLIKHFTHLLPHSPNPVSALLHFREFMAQLFERPNWTAELVSLERPEVLNGLARLLGESDFLWDDFLRMQYANLFPVVRDVDALMIAKSRPQLQAELEEVLRPIHSGPQPPREDAPWKQALNAFKDREMFRIDMRHILGHTVEFHEFSEELTDLAEVVVNTAYHLTAEDLRSVHGTPLREDGAISQMAVVALGKCGGRELGFASDIELMLIYDGNGQTTGPEVISSAEFHEKVVQSFIQSIHTRREGIFEVDLQLRPYGKAGSLAVSLEAFKNYFAPGGPAWAYERQALVKLRPIAGDEALGEQIARLRDAFVYTGEPFDVSAMRAMRERQVRHLVTASKINPKFSPGGLVDIEYLVQGLQITHGKEMPALRIPNTRQAMSALAEASILSADDYLHLRKAHTFLRWLIDSLRVVRGNAKDVTVPPEDSEEFAYLARRLRFGSDRARLQRELTTHMANVLEINMRLLN